MSLKIGVVGLGAMGAPMAMSLHRAGFLHRIWNRTPSRADHVAKETGVETSADISSLARDCDGIILSVSCDQDLLEVVAAIAATAQSGLTVIDTSTVAATTAQQAAKMLEERGAFFLDAPVSGGVEGAKNGALAMMVGGDEVVLERMRPALEAVAAKIVHMGPVGAGQATKAVNQLMAAGINQAVTESLAFAQALDLPLDKVIDVVGGGAAANWFLDYRGSSMVEGGYDPGFKLSLHRKDLEICRQMMAGLSESRLPLVEMTLIHYKRLMDAGFGDEDISALFREKQKLFG